MGNCLASGGDDHVRAHRRRIALLIRDLVNRELNRSEDAVPTEVVEQTKRTILEILADLERNDVWHDVRTQMVELFQKIDNLLFLVFVINNHSQPVTADSTPPPSSSRISLLPDLTTRMQIRAEYLPHLDAFVQAFAPHHSNV